MIFNYRGAGSDPVELAARRLVGGMVVIHSRPPGRGRDGNFHTACDYVVTEEEWLEIVKDIAAESARHARVETQRRMDEAKEPA
jgi:hypothetical protein